MEQKFTKEHTSIAKASAIILMFAHHLFAFPERISEGDYISLIPFLEIAGKSLEFHLGTFGKVCVAMYLFLSGYGLAAADEKKEFTIKDSAVRLKKMYINYWIAFFLFVPAGFLFFGKEFHLGEFIKNLVGINSTYNGEWWFLRLYIILLLTFPFTRKFTGRNLFKGLFVTGAIYFVSLSVVLFFKVYPEYKYLMGNFWFGLLYEIAFWQCPFFLGAIAFKFRLLEEVKEGFQKLGMDKRYIYASIMVLLIIFRLGLKNYGPAFDFIIAPVFVFSTASLFYGTKLMRPLNVLGKHSTNMWLTHSFFCYTYFQKFVFSLKYSPLIMLLLVIVTLVASAIINKIILLAYIQATPCQESNQSSSFL